MTRVQPKRLLLASGIGIATSIGLVHLNRGGQARPVTTRPVVVVAQAAPAQAPLTASELRIEPRPVAYLAPGAMAQLSQAVGRVPRADLVAGEQLQEAMLYPPGSDGSEVAFPLPPGKRAVTVAVNEVVGVAGFVQPGSVVDVIGTMDIGNTPFSRIILQDIPVLAIAQDAEHPEDPRAKIVSSATLAVTPLQAEKVILASERGKIRLAMRNPEETKVLKLPDVTPQTLEGYDAPAHAGHRYRRAVSEPAILVIRGSSTEVVYR